MTKSLTETQKQALALRVGAEALRADKQRRKLWGNLWEFTQAMWPVIEPHTKFKTNWHHELICWHLQRVAEGKELRLLINVPPGSGKSSITSVMFPAWCWVTRPGYSTMHVSYDDELILRDAEKSQTIMQSPEYQALIPTLFGPGKNEKWILDAGRKALSYYQNSERGFRLSTTVRGANTGHRANCFGGETLVATDQGNIPIARLVRLTEKPLVLDRVRSRSDGYREMPKHVAPRPRAWSYNLREKRLELRDIRGGVTTYYQEVGDITFENNTTIRCTPEHKFFFNNRYVEAKDLQLNQPLLVRKDMMTQALTVTKIWTKTDTLEDVYCIDVDKNHNFFAEGVLVQNCLVIDDAAKAKDANNKIERDRVIDWWTQSMTSRVADPDTSAFIIIGQRLHEEDLPGYLIARDERKLQSDPDWRAFTQVVIPTEFNPEHRTPGDPRTEKGQLMHPDLFNARANAEAKEDLQSYGYSAQHDQNPVPADGGLFEMKRLVFWYDPVRTPPEPHYEPGAKQPNDQVELPTVGWEAGAQSWDLTFKDSINSDFVCGQYWRRQKGKLYLIDQSLARRTFTDTVKEIENFTRKHPKAIAKYVEAKANGDAVIDTLKSKIMGIVPVTPEGGKVGRVHAISPLISAGNVVLPHPKHHPWVMGMLAEMRGFPRAKHDDQVDAMSQALTHMYTGNNNLYRALARGGRK